MTRMDEGEEFLGPELPEATGEGALNFAAESGPATPIGPPGFTK